MAGNRTRINCLEGSYADHYTTIASCLRRTYYNYLNTIADYIVIFILYGQVLYVTIYYCKLHRLLNKIFNNITTYLVL